MWNSTFNHSICMHVSAMDTCGHDWGPHKAKEAVKNLRQSTTPLIAHIEQGSVQVQAESSPNAHLKDCGSLEDLERQLHSLRQVYQRA